MKICILGDARSVHLQRIVPGLVERGVSVHVVTHNPADVAGATVERFAIPTVRWGYVARWQERWQRYLRDLMRRFDVVHVHFMHDWGFTPEITAQGCFAVTPWGSDIVDPPGETPPSFDRKEDRRELLRCADGVTAWGPWFAGRIADYAAIDVERIDLLPLGVDARWFRPPAACDHPHGDSTEHHCSPHVRHGGRTLRCRVGFFKGFRPVYGATYLIRAIPTVVEALPDTRFDLVGDGEQRLQCQQLAAMYEVEQYVNWRPRQPHRNIRNFIAGWDLTVVPSVRESFGAAVLESQACGVPVVASNVGGLVDTVIDGQTGLLVPPAAPEQLADAIITLLGDDGARRRMGEAGRRFVVEHYEWEGILDRWVETYEKIRDQCIVMV